MSEADYDPAEEFKGWALIKKQIDLETNLLEFYVHIMRILLEKYGDEVMDLAEDLRRKDGRAVGQQMKKVYGGSGEPAQLLKDEFTRYSDSNFARKIPLFFSVPSKDRFELVVVHCPAGALFRDMQEPELGLSWCAYDFGYMSGLSDDRIALLAPQTINVGHPCCYQIFQVTDDPKETKRLMDPEHTGWHRYSKAQTRETSLGELPQRERFFPTQGFDNPMTIQVLQNRVNTLERNGCLGFVRFIRLVADRFGEEVFDHVEALFLSRGISPEQLRVEEPRKLQGWFWESESGLE